MALATCKLIWINQLIHELKFVEVSQLKLLCDNQTTIYIASNPVFHERIKHIEIDYHFVQEKVLSSCIVTSYVNSNNQLTNILTKSLKGPHISFICNKLSAYDLYVPA